MPRGLDALVCPYCQGSLIKRMDYLICRYHKIAFSIQKNQIDFRWECAHKFNIIEDLFIVKEISDNL